MAYLALYRKYRPQTFSDVVGQDAVVRTLQNAITNNMLAHAYVFSGPRGTGKTSMARILAKALNCREGTSIKPCLKCDLCSRIATGEALDVFEIDAASNRRIDDIRDLRDKIRFAPVEGKYKIYIIDEAHMLTDEAFNALLKTLEEPPENTLFIMATTDAHKIPVTILSRCQRLDFKRLTIPDILVQLKKICKSEGIIIEDKALTLIAKAAEGGMRDSVSILDQIFSFKGKEISVDDVLGLLGAADTMALYTLVEQISTNDTGSALKYLEELIISGKNVQQLTKDLMQYYRHLVLAKAGATDAIDLPGEQIQQIVAQATRYTMEELKSSIRLLSKADNDMRWYHNARLLLEIALVEISGMKGSSEKAVQAPAPKIVQPVQIPKKPIAEKAAPRTIDTIVEKKAEQIPEVPKRDPEPAAPATTTAPVETTSNDMQSLHSLADIKHHWQDILNKVKERKKFTFLILCESEPVEMKDGKLLLRFKKNSTFHKEKFLDKEHQDVFVSVLKEYITGLIAVNADVEELLAAPGTVASAHELKTTKKDTAHSPVAKTLIDMFDGKVLHGK